MLPHLANRPFVSLLLGSLLPLACLLTGEGAGKAAGEAGSIESLQHLGLIRTSPLTSIANPDLRRFLPDSAAISGPSRHQEPGQSNAIDLYRIRYWSRAPELKSTPVLASGLLAIPRGDTQRIPLLSYQHGTVFERHAVPSNPPDSIETRLVLAEFAAQGHAVIAADGIGLGDSEQPNAYFIKKSTEAATYDLYRAAQSFLAQQGKDVCAINLMGWSQGVFSTIVLLQKLEQQKIPVTAAVTVAGPVDLLRFVENSLQLTTNDQPGWRVAALVNLLFSLETFGHRPGLTQAAIQPAYLAISKHFYAFKVGATQFLEVAPADPRLLLDSNFIAGIFRGNSRLIAALNAQSPPLWLGKAIHRIYASRSDEVVAYDDAIRTYIYSRRHGKRNVELIEVPGANHRSIFFHALRDARPWVDSLSSSCPALANG